jgi:GTPase SAR1 family protein
MTFRGDLVASLRVYDIGGQSLNSKNLREYLSGASVIFLVYDVTNRESFGNLDDWLAQVRKNSKTTNIYVIGNKVRSDMIFRMNYLS